MNLPSGVLVSDFDGTMTTHDFYRLALASLIPSSTPDYWAAYRAGEITHFEALQRYFASIRQPESDVLDVVWSMELDPDLKAAVGSLHAAGWKVLVASAGCEWYITKLLERAGVPLEVHSNPGNFVAGQGLLMRLPTTSTYLSPELGIDKAAIVQHYLNLGTPVAYAGDGYPDVMPAKMVADHLRFARGDLADVLRREGLGFRGYRSWSEIARQIASGNE